MAKHPASNDPATELLVSTIASVVTEMIEAKCQRLSNRDRGTLERRIRRAVATFVQGMQLSREQQRGEAKREALRRERK